MLIDCLSFRLFGKRFTMMLAHPIQSSHTHTHYKRTTLAYKYRSRRGDVAKAKMKMERQKKKRKKNKTELNYRCKKRAGNTLRFEWFSARFTSISLHHAMALTLHSVPSLFNCFWQTHTYSENGTRGWKINLCDVPVRVQFILGAFCVAQVKQSFLFARITFTLTLHSRWVCAAISWWRIRFFDSTKSSSTFAS